MGNRGALGDRGSVEVTWGNQLIDDVSIKEGSSYDVGKVTRTISEIARERVVTGAMGSGSGRVRIANADIAKCPR